MSCLMMLIQALPQRQNLDKYLEVSDLTQYHNNRWFKYKILIGKSVVGSCVRHQSVRLSLFLKNNYQPNSILALRGSGD